MTKDNKTTTAKAKEAVNAKKTLTIKGEGSKKLVKADTKVKAATKKAATNQTAKVGKTEPVNMPKRVPYKKLNMELESKLMTSQSEVKRLTNDIAALRDNYVRKTVHIADLKAENLIEATGRWLGYKSAGVNTTFWLVAAVDLILAGLGVVHLIAG